MLTTSLSLKIGRGPPAVLAIVRVVSDGGVCSEDVQILSAGILFEPAGVRQVNNARLCVPVQGINLVQRAVQKVFLFYQRDQMSVPHIRTCGFHSLTATI